MKRFMERKLAERKAGPGGQVTVFILLAILFLCVADLSWANPKSKLKAISPKTWNFDTEKVGTLLGEISASSNEQAKAAEQITTAVGQMDQVTQSNAATAEETAASSEELSSQAIQVSDAVGELQRIVGGAAIDVAAHGDRGALAPPETTHLALPGIGGNRIARRGSLKDKILSHEGSGAAVPAGERQGEFDESDFRDG